MSIPRDGIRGGTRNELMQSVVRQGHRKRIRDEKKAKMELMGRDKQVHLWDNEISANDYHKTTDDGLAGVMELGILTQNGKVDTKIQGPIMIGEREHVINEGKVRIISKEAVDKSLIPIMQRKRYNDAVLQAILTDREGRVARMFLGSDRYNSLLPGGGGFGFLGKTYEQYVEGAPAELIAANGQPPFFLLYHSSTKEFTLGLMKLTLLVDRTSITFDEEVIDWLEKYSAGGGKVHSSEPRV
jgi:hypothetical protein